MPKRTWTDLSKLTLEERIERQRARKREATRRFRSDPDKLAAELTRSNKRRSAARAAERDDPEWRDGRRRQLENISPLGRVIDEEHRLSGERYEDLTVLSVRNDPFRLDTPAVHRDAKWVGDQLDFVAPGMAIHLRGLHYRLVAHGNIIKPDGTAYINDDVSYAWLNLSAKSARYLGYVRFERILDNRNDEPLTVLPVEPGSRQGWAVWSDIAPVQVPDFTDHVPTINLSGGYVPQLYRIILIGEKSSLRSELEPIRATVNAELILPSGELSETLIYGMAERAAADPRPSVVLYFSDFDPAGHQMPVSLARKLQALKVLFWPDLEIQVHHVALTLETCIRLDLPSTPLKETELRADRWRERFGREQTEIDALAALHPGELRRIAREVVEPFYDFMLASRMADAEEEWFEAAEQVLVDSPEYQAEIALFAERVAKAKATIADAVNDVNLSQEAALEHIEDLGLEFEPFEPPEVEITTEAPRPLFDSNETWAEQTRRLKERKALADNDDDDT